ncbi:MAG: hypothetical protein ACPF8V_02290, partial [Luteibaculum sp.]
LLHGFFYVMKILLLFTFLLFSGLVLTAQNQVQEQSNEPELASFKEANRSSVLALTLLLGPLGGHRVLMGTKFYIPLAYALTLGGGLGLVPVIDFFVCLFKKDLKEFHENPHFLMWLKSKPQKE